MHHTALHAQDMYEEQGHAVQHNIMQITRSQAKVVIAEKQSRHLTLYPGSSHDVGVLVGKLYKAILLDTQYLTVTCRIFPWMNDPVRTASLDL